MRMTHWPYPAKPGWTIHGAPNRIKVALHSWCLPSPQNSSLDLAAIKRAERAVVQPGTRRCPLRLRSRVALAPPERGGSHAELPKSVAVDPFRLELVATVCCRPGAGGGPPPSARPVRA